MESGTIIKLFKPSSHVTHGDGKSRGKSIDREGKGCYHRDVNRIAKRQVPARAQ